MYAYLVIFAFSKCFLPLAESDLVQTITESINLYNMRKEAKIPYDYLMRRPTVGRSKNLAVYKGYRRSLFQCNCSCRPTKLYLSADKNAKFLSPDSRPIVCLNVIAVSCKYGGHKFRLFLDIFVDPTFSHHATLYNDHVS